MEEPQIAEGLLQARPRSVDMGGASRAPMVRLLGGVIPDEQQLGVIWIVNLVQGLHGAFVLLPSLQRRKVVLTIHKHHPRVLLDRGAALGRNPESWDVGIQIHHPARSLQDRGGMTPHHSSLLKQRKNTSGRSRLETSHLFVYPELRTVGGPKYQIGFRWVGRNLVARN